MPRFSKGPNRAGRSPHPTSKLMAFGTIEEATSENANSYPVKNSNQDATSNSLRKSKNLGSDSDCMARVDFLAKSSNNEPSVYR